MFFGLVADFPLPFDMVLVSTYHKRKSVVNHLKHIPVDVFWFEDPCFQQQCELQYDRFNSKIKYCFYVCSKHIYLPEFLTGE